MNHNMYIYNRLNPRLIDFQYKEVCYTSKQDGPKAHIP